MGCSLLLLPVVCRLPERPRLTLGTDWGGWGSPGGKRSALALGIELKAPFPSSLWGPLPCRAAQEVTESQAPPSTFIGAAVWPTREDRVSVLLPPRGPFPLGPGAGKSGEEAGSGLSISHPPPPGGETPGRPPSAQLKGLRPFLD